VRELLIYWIVGCLLVGAGLGQRELRCPREKSMSEVDIVAAVATWPAVFTWAWIAPTPPACREDKP
jgi:hypothetical protein